MIPSHIPAVAIPPCEVRSLRASRRPTTPKMIAATGNIMPGPPTNTTIVLVQIRPQVSRPHTTAIHGDFDSISLTSDGVTTSWKVHSPQG